MNLIIMYSKGYILHRRILSFAAALFCVVFGTTALSEEHDPFHTEIPTEVSAHALDNLQNPCGIEALPKPLTLLAAVGHALCHNPKTLQAWANIQLQSAQVGVQKSAYLPTLDATVQLNRDTTSTHVFSDTTLSSDTANAYQQQSLNLSWLLFDFGNRSANLENAKQLLLAAQQTHLSTIQTVFLSTAKDYYDVIAAQTSEESTLEIEKAAQQSLDAATARVNKGIAPISDQFQAQTAYAHAVFNRVKAQGNLRATKGLLALDMALPPDTSFIFSEVDDHWLQDSSFIQSINNLLQEAELSHPDVLGAQAQVAAAEAREKAAESTHYPTVNLTAKMNHNNQPVSPGLGLDSLDARTNERYIGVQVNVPLFEGFSTTYKTRSARADLEVQEDKLKDVSQQVAQNVWVNYQTFLTNTENLHNTDTFLNSARKQFTAARHRYQHGVTSILELMSAQTALSDALEQHTRALSDWRTTRLKLAASIGRLGVWAIR